MNIVSIKKRNQEMILREIYKKENISRAELSNKLNLSKPAIYDNTIFLMKNGIIEEVGRGKPTSNGGKPPIMLRFNYTYKYVIAIDLNYDKPIFVIIDLKGNIKTEIEIKIPNDISKEEQVSVIEDNILSLIKQSRLSLKQMFCIAIASPGVFDDDGNLLSNNLSFSGINWGNYNLNQKLSKRFGIKVILINDIKSAGLGELSLEPEVQNFLLISCGKGLGSSLILDGKLYEGKNKMVGEIYNYLDYSFIKTKNTMEQNICIKGLIEKCQKALSKNTKKYKDIKGYKPLNFETIVKMYLEKNKVILKVVQEICDQLCIIVCNYANFISIDKVVLSGDYIVFADTFKKQFQNKFINYCNIVPDIVISSMKRYEGIYGLLFKARDLLFSEVIL